MGKNHTLRVAKRCALGVYVRRPLSYSPSLNPKIPKFPSPLFSSLPLDFDFGWVCTQGVALGWYVLPRWGLDSADSLRLSGFGHLGGTIMGVFALFGGDFAILFIGTFVTYSNIGRVYSNIGRVYFNIGGVYSNKTRQIKTLFCASQHVPNTKFAPKCVFCPIRRLYWRLSRHFCYFALTPTGRGCFWSMWTFRKCFPRRCVFVYTGSITGRLFP